MNVAEFKAILQMEGKKKKKNKYNAVKVLQDDITFDSKGENNRYNVLKNREDKGEISDLRTHVRYPLLCVVMGFKEEKLIGYYEVDFEYILTATRKLKSEDYKGVMNSLSRWKIKHFENQYGRKVDIITRATVRK